jgi:hypothetical protein
VNPSDSTSAAPSAPFSTTAIGRPHPPCSSVEPTRMDLLVPLPSGQGSGGRSGAQLLCENDNASESGDEVVLHPQAQPDQLFLQEIAVAARVSRRESGSGRGEKRSASSGETPLSPWPGRRGEDLHLHDRRAPYPPTKGVSPEPSSPQSSCTK